MVNTVPSDYVTGTITLTNGSAAFTGTGTGWLAMMFRQGDMILDLEDAPEFIAIIDEVTSNTAGVLTRPWLGPTFTGAYRMRYQWDAGRVTAMSAFLREELGNGNLQAFAALVGSAGGVPVFIGPGAMEVRPATDFINGVSYDVQVDTLADRAAFDGQSEGFSVLVSNVGDGRSALYSKASNAVGDWTDPAYITGPIGASPNFAAGTTTTVPPGTPADVDVVPDGSGGYLFDFDIPAGEGFVSRGAYSGATAYNKGDVVQNNGSSWVAKTATTGNAPPALPTTSNTWWELLAAKGADGTGTGDVVGPASAADGAFAGFDGTTGKLIKQLSNTVATSMLNAFAVSLKGLVPAPSAGDVTAGRVLGAGGTWQDAPISIGTMKIRVFTASGTYTPDPNLIFAVAEVQGAGGGGGGVTGSASYCLSGSGGGAGAFAKKVLLPADIGAGLAVTIGTGGSAGSSGVTGGTGGNTSVGSLCSAAGGTGAPPTTSASVGSSGVGGATGVGDLVIPGGDGSRGGYSATASTLIAGGSGAPSYSAGGGRGGWAGGGSVQGGSVGGTGAGGGGGFSAFAALNSIGAAGGNGLVIITEYCEV